LILNNDGVANNGLTITDGTLQVVPGATLEVSAGATTMELATKPAVAGNVLPIGYLALADGATLSLATAAGGANIGSVDIGDTDITIASTITASGGTVTLGNNMIQGSVSGAALKVVKGNATFRTNAGRLTLEQVNLDLITSGVLGTTVATDRLSLTKGAKLTLKTDEGGVETPRRNIGAAGAGNNAEIEGDVVCLIAPSAGNSQAVLSVAHKGGSDVTITKGIINLSRSGTNFIQ
jgi:hypothetical protein